MEKLNLHYFTKKLKLSEQLFRKEINFEYVFPILYNFLSLLPDNTKVKFLDDKIFTNILKDKLLEFESEIDKALMGEWLKLKKAYDYTCLHTIKCLVLVFYDLWFIKNKISEYDKNIMLWSILLHDISKYVILKPSLKENFDEVK